MNNIIVGTARGLSNYGICHGMIFRPILGLDPVNTATSSREGCSHRSSVLMTGTLLAVGLLVFAAQAVHGAHYRAATASYTLSDAGLLTVEVFSVWGSFNSVPSFPVTTAPGGGGAYLGHMSLQSTTLPYATGTEFGGAPFTVRRDVFTFNLSGQAPGMYYARWSTCCRVGGINNVGETSWSIELGVRFNGIGIGTGNGSPTLPPATIDIIGRGVSYSQNLNSVDPDGTPVAYQFLGGTSGGGATAPNWGPATDVPGLVLNPTTGVISMSAANSATLALGRWAYKVRVTDGSGAYAERDVLVLSQETDAGGDPNTPPFLNSIGSKQVNVNATLSFNVSATDAEPAQLLTLKAIGLPAGASFPKVTSVSPVSSTFNWTPGPGSEGVYNVFFEVSDDHPTILIDSELVSITVTGDNNPPVLDSIGNKTVANGGTLSFAISGSDVDPGDSLGYSAFFLPAGADFNPATQEFSWTPSPAQYDTTFANVTFRVTDDGAPPLFSEESIFIAVGAGNRAPIIAPTSDIYAAPGNLVQFNVLATDSSPAQTITLSPGSGGLPTGATFPVVSGISPVSSTFSWTPTIAQQGTFIVNIRAEDNGVPLLATEISVNIVVILSEPGSLFRFR